MKSPASNHSQTTCDSEQLRRSLDDSLSEHEEEQLARHLSDCADCQRELEQLAADCSDWSLVSEVLQRESSSSLDAKSQTSDPVTPDDLVAEQWADAAADFAVDFLEPSENGTSIGRLGGIEIRSVIGAGGMGVVLKGYQPELNRPVAVKVLAPHLATSGAARRRFAREAQAAAIIVHPSVMPILAVDSSGRLPFLVMPYIDCESLQDRIDRDGPPQTVDILRIALQTARGLEAAHAQGLVHRDIKPANILLEHGIDRVLLTDFGLARAADDASLTRTGVIAGTPAFMSPEQARGDSVDARSDLFSFGSVLYVLCTGRPPFRAETSYGILRRITDDEHRSIREINPDVPDWLCHLVDRLLRKDCEDRPATATEVAELLEQCLAHVQQPAAVKLPRELQVTRSHGTHRSGRRLASRIVLVGAVVALTVAGTALLHHPGQSDNDEPVPGAVQNQSTSQSPAALSSRTAPSIAGEATNNPAWHDGLDADINDLASETDRVQTLIQDPWRSGMPGSASSADPLLENDASIARKDSDSSQRTEETP